MYPRSPKLRSHPGCHMTLSRVPPALYSRPLLLIYVKNSSTCMYMSIPNSVSLPPATISSFGKWYYFDDCSVKCIWRPHSVESSLCPPLPEISSFQWNWCFPPTSIPFRKWWDSRGDDSVTGNGHVPWLMIVPEATGSRLCWCLSVEAMCFSTHHTDLWDQEFQITKCKSFIRLLICAECEVRHSESINRIVS